MVKVKVEFMLSKRSFGKLTEAAFKLIPRKDWANTVEVPIPEVVRRAVLKYLKR